MSTPFTKLPVVLLLCLCCHCTWGWAQSDLTITITNISATKGQILYSLYNQEKGFPDDPARAFRRGAIPVNGTQLTHVEKNLPAGTYAISLVHDENGNNRLDKNLMGIPTESFAFSNNVMGAFGPPKFSKASFIVQAGAKSMQTIRLRRF